MKYVIKKTRLIAKKNNVTISLPLTLFFGNTQHIPIVKREQEKIDNIYKVQQELNMYNNNTREPRNQGHIQIYRC